MTGSSSSIGDSRAYIATYGVAQLYLTKRDSNWEEKKEVKKKLYDLSYFW